MRSPPAGVRDWVSPKSSRPTAGWARVCGDGFNAPAIGTNVIGLTQLGAISCLDHLAHRRNFLLKCVTPMSDESPPSPALLKGRVKDGSRFLAPIHPPAVNPDVFLLVETGPSPPSVASALVAGGLRVWLLKVGYRTIASIGGGSRRACRRCNNWRESRSGPIRPATRYLRCGS